MACYVFSVAAWMIVGNIPVMIDKMYCTYTMAQIYIKFSWTSHFSFISWHSDKILNKVYID